MIDDFHGSIRGNASFCVCWGFVAGNATYYMRGQGNLETEEALMKLTKERFEDACEFIRKNARPLDQSMFRYHFEEGSKEDVLIELAQYQNLDGGFGNGIEPDIRLKASSPMATSVGLQYYLDANGDPDSDMVKGAIEYLVSTYDASDNYWPSTFADVNNEPHAPWWYVKKIESPQDESWANPSAELAGYLNSFSGYVPIDLLAQINQKAKKILENQSIIPGSLYNILCWNRVYKHFPESISAKIRNKLLATFMILASKLQEKMGEIRIFWIVSDEENLLLSHPKEVHRLLELEIGRQTDDGGWWPTWKWGQFEDIWAIAEKEWAGKMTYGCLRTLRNLNRKNNLIEKLE